MLEQIKDGRTDLVFKLVKNASQATTRDEGGVALIKWCAYYGDVSAVRYLLSMGASLESLGPNYDLQGAAFHGHWQLCQFLLEQGAKVSYAHPDTGETALHSATSKSGQPAHAFVVQVLLAAGADPNRKTIPGVETGDFMRDCRTRGETPLHRAAALSGRETISQLIDAGAEVEQRDAHGDTPLCWASWYGRPRSVLRLLCYGDHQVASHPAEQTQMDHATSRLGEMELNLLGRPHL